MPRSPRTRSRSLAFHPAFLSAARDAGDRSGSHDRRIDAGLRPGNDARQRQVLAKLTPPRIAFISTTAAAPSVMPDALAAVTVPSLSKAGTQLAIDSSVTPVWILVGIDHDITLARLDRHRRRVSSLNRPGLLRRLPPCSAKFRDEITPVTISRAVVVDTDSINPA